MQAKDVMTTNVVTVTGQTDVRMIAQRLLERGISAVPVVDDRGRLIGIVSEGDLMRRVESGTERQPSWWLRAFSSTEDRARDYTRSHALKAEDVMTREVITAAEDTPLAEIATLLERHRIKRVPVVRDGKVVGIVSRANLLHGLAVSYTVPTPTAGDNRIREAIVNELAASGVRTEFINIVVSDGVAHLWGAVETDEEKQAARVAAERAAGVKRVEDNTSVMRQMVRATLWV